MVYPLRGKNMRHDERSGSDQALGQQGLAQRWCLA